MNWKSLKFFKSEKWKTLKAIEGYPEPRHRLRAFKLTPFDDVKVVILGQDPYPTKGRANGLAFSVFPNTKPVPASLRNILSEYTKDLGHPYPSTGDLTQWAQQGVLLLNTILTVPDGQRLGHDGLGWERLIHEALSTLSRKRNGIVWMLWGAKANEYRAVIDEDRHLVISSGHPSPLARLAPYPFLGSKPFSKCNAYLKSQNITPINWRLP